MPVTVKSGPGSGLKPFAARTATPGIFWEAIVTIKSGKATLKSAETEKTGVIRVGTAKRSIEASSAPPFAIPMTKTTLTKAAGTANSRLIRAITAQTKIMNRPIAGLSETA